MKRKRVRALLQNKTKKTNKFLFMKTKSIVRELITNARRYSVPLRLVNMQAEISKYVNQVISIFFEDFIFLEKFGWNSLIFL
jgi:hypothetical protein